MSENHARTSLVETFQMRKLQVRTRRNGAPLDTALTTRCNNVFVNKEGADILYTGLVLAEILPAIIAI